MRPLSAADALAPAWRHTVSLLWRPFRWRTSLKIAAVAFLASIAGFNFSFNQFRHSPMPQIHGLAAVMFAWMATIFVIGLIIGLILLYIGSRMQFVLFEVVLRRDVWISPIWQRYGTKTWRWIGLKLLLYLAMLICILPVMIPIIIHIVRTQPQGQIPPDRFAEFFVAIFGFVSFIFVFILIFMAIYTLLSDFGLPSMALEDTTLKETVARIGRLYRAEPGQVTLYLFLRLLLQFAGGMLAEIAVALVCLIAAIPLGGAGVGWWLLFRHEGIAGRVLMIGGWVVLGVVLLVVAFVVVMLMVGWMTTFLEAYALYFLGGRYPLVGQYLEPLLPPPFVPYAQAGYPVAPEAGAGG